jgi:hypothetical protein
MIILDKKYNTTPCIYAYLTNTDNTLQNTSGIFLIKIMKSNATRDVIVSDTAMTLVGIAAGKYQYEWDLSTVPEGSYIADFVCVESGLIRGYSEEIIVQNDGDAFNFDKNKNETAILYANFADATGNLTEVSAPENRTITITPAISGESAIVNTPLTPDTPDGKFYYPWDLSSVEAGNYRVEFSFVADGKTYVALNQILIVDSSYQPVTVVNTNKPKIFTDNLIIGTAESEPAGITNQGVSEYIKDNTTETGITIYPDFTGTGYVIVKPDGDMDATTAWTYGGGVSSIAADTADYVIGSASISATTGSDTDFYIEWTGTAQDITNLLIGSFILKITSDLPSADMPIKVKLTLTDGSAEESNFETTTDYLKNVIDTKDTWYYLMFNLQNYGDIDLTDIVKIKITIELLSGTQALNFKADGLRFLPHYHDFIYDFGVNKLINFVQVKGCNSAIYDVKRSVSTAPNTYIDFLDGNFSEATDYFTDYDSTGVSAQKIRLILNAINYNGDFDITLNVFNVLTQVYEWTDTPKHSPKINFEIKENKNWIGASIVEKNRKNFSCDLEFTGFDYDHQSDLEKAEELFKSDEAFYYWLNGGNTDNAYQSQGEVWKYDNIYRVISHGNSFKEGHYNGQSDLNNMTEKNILSLVECAYLESI